MNKLFKIKNLKLNKNFLYNFFKLVLIIFISIFIFHCLKILKFTYLKKNSQIIEGFNTFNVIDSRIIFFNHKQWTSGINSLLKNTKEL